MKIITLTMNPALDKNAKVDELIAFEKLESHDVVYHPGGGGVNVSRVLHRLQVNSSCVFPYGGKTGEHLVELLDKENINTFSSVISSTTRENFAVVEQKTGKQYRFGMPTINFIEDELKEVEKTINNLVGNGDLFVISGSLPPGLPIDYYSKLVNNLTATGVKVVVDTSGKAFREVLKNDLYLIKPNNSELLILAGKKEMTREEQKSFALKMVQKGKVKYVVVSLGADGAFMAHKDGVEDIKSPKINVKSTVGAGDSMVAGLLYGIINKLEARDILRWGVACGSSATQSDGSDLAHKKEIQEILKTIE